MTATRKLNSIQKAKLGKALKVVATALVSFLVVVVVGFILPRLLPGDPVAYLTGFDEEEMSQEKYDYYYHALHLDEDTTEQFGYYLEDIFDGSLGYSFKKETTVSSLIGERIGYTLQITLPAILISVAIGLCWGLRAGHKKGGVFDNASTAFNVVLNAVPSFAIALVLLVALSVEGGIFPSAGLSSAGKSRFADRLIHLILPVLTLVLASTPSRYLVVRNSTALFSDDMSVRYARERGFSDCKIEFSYILKNVAHPFVTMIGTALGGCFAGSVVVENVFSINGIGRLLYDAVYTLDYPLMQGILFVTSIAMIIAIAVSDLALIAITPMTAEVQK